MMKARYRALALPAIALCACVYTGCGPSNEDTLKGESKVTPQRTDIPNFSGYGDAMKYQAEQAAKKKGTKGTTEKKEAPAPAPDKTKEAEKTK
jgi:hypothetical protein